MHLTAWLRLTLMNLCYEQIFSLNINRAICMMCGKFKRIICLSVKDILQYLLLFLYYVFDAIQFYVNNN